MVCSRARSSSDKTTMCRLRTSASCSGGLPGPHEHETEPHISQVTTDELLARHQRRRTLAAGRPGGGRRSSMEQQAREQAFITALTTEHFVLQSTRSATIGEANSG